MYYDRLTDIFRFDVIVYSRTDNLEEIQKQLNEWENAGYLTVLKPIHDCMDQEACIRLLGPVPLPR
jgi:hypothetical protein